MTSLLRDRRFQAIYLLSTARYSVLHLSYRPRPSASNEIRANLPDFSLRSIKGSRQDARIAKANHSRFQSSWRSSQLGESRFLSPAAGLDGPTTNVYVTPTGNLSGLLTRPTDGATIPHICRRVRMLRRYEAESPSRASTTYTAAPRAALRARSLGNAKQPFSDGPGNVPDTFSSLNSLGVTKESYNHC